MAKNDDKNANQNDPSKDPKNAGPSVNDPIENAKGGTGSGAPAGTHVPNTGLAQGGGQGIIPGGAGGTTMGAGSGNMPPVGQPPEPILEQTVDQRKKGAPVYIVENPNNMTVSWKGQDVRLYPGAEISEDSYGDGAIEQFRTAGVKLRKKD